MRYRQLLIVYRLVFAVLTTAAIVTQYIVRSHAGSFNPAHFFSFFTIESNIFAASMLLISGFALLRKKRSAALDAWRGAATVYMITTGIVYVLLLSGNEVALQTTIPWVNTVLHYILPVVMLLDWLVDPPTRRISLRQMAAWLAFPITYLVYSLVRGPQVNWYSYPFLDPRPHGYLAVAITAVGIAAAVATICFIVRWLGNRRATR